jgi:hypothetical protein
MKRFVFGFMAALTLISGMLPISAYALSQEQQRLLDSGIYYYDTATSCTDSAATPSGSSSGNTKLDLAAIAKKYGIGWAEVKQLGSSVVDSYNASTPPPAPASVLKLVIADVFLHTNPDLSAKAVIKSNDIYDPNLANGDPQTPKAGQAGLTLGNMLTETLMDSSDTDANVLIDASGGLDKANQSAHALGYKGTTIGSYYNSRGKVTNSANQSTVSDLTDAMDNVYGSTSLKYQPAQDALRKDKVTWGLQSEANKWGGVSNVTGNSAVFNINSSKYIITMYDDKNGEQGPNTPGAQPIQDATNTIVDTLRNSTSGTTNTSSDCSACIVDQTGGVYKFVQTLAYHESGDVVTADNGGATGKYQYEPGTWASSAKSYYAPAAQFANAKDAPEGVQDAVAYIEYSVKFIQYGGDLKKLAVSHIYPAVANDPAQWATFRIDKNPTAQEYADLFLQQYNQGKGQDDPLKFNDAPEFASWYAKSVGKPYANSQDNGTASCSSGSPSASYVFYDQNDPKWAGHAYGSSTVAASGCGPTSVAMVVATLSDNSVTPAQTAAFGTRNGAFIPNVGSDHQKMLVDGPEHWGLKVTPLGTSLSKAANMIRQGGLVIAAGTGLSPFSKEGHIIVLRAVDSSGKFLIGNPAPGLQAGQDETFSSTDLQSAGLQALYGVTK